MPSPHPPKHTYADESTRTVDAETCSYGTEHDIRMACTIHASMLTERITVRIIAFLHSGRRRPGKQDETFEINLHTMH